MKLLVILFLSFYSLADEVPKPDTSAQDNAATQAEAEARAQIAAFKMQVDEVRIATNKCNRSDFSETNKIVCVQVDLKLALDNVNIREIKALNACNSTASITQKACTASTYSPWASLVISQFNNANSASSYQKCKSAATLQAGMGAVSGALAASCYFTKRKCESACGTVSKEFAAGLDTIQRSLVLVERYAPELMSNYNSLQNSIATATSKVESCEKNDLNIASAILSVQQFVQGIAQSQSCQKDLQQEECLKPEAVNNPACAAAYCSVAANQSSPQCVAMFGECYSASAASNPRCACLQNPMQEGCLNLPNIDTNTATRSTASGSTTDGYNFDEDDIYGAQGDALGFGDANAKAPGVVGGVQSGSGGGSGNGSPLGGGPGGGGGSGAQKGVYDTNVTGGTSAGAVSGGGTGGGNSGYGSGLNSYAGGNGAGGMNFGKSSLDLKKYLPGGQYANKREESDTGITPANGLSNFQKANRAHNNNRTKLVEP